MTSPHDVLTELQLRMLADAGYVIVKRPSEDWVQAAAKAIHDHACPSEDRVQAALNACWSVYSEFDSPDERSMEAALAAADAADTRPRELHGTLMWRADSLTLRGYCEHGREASRAARLVADKFNLPEVSDGDV